MILGRKDLLARLAKESPSHSSTGKRRLRSARSDNAKRPCLGSLRPRPDPVGSLMVADSLEGLGCLADDIRVSAGCGFA